MCRTDYKCHYIHDKSHPQYDSRKGVCNRRYSLGFWTNHERMIRDPFWNSSDICKDCLKWLENNRQDVLEDWQMAKELKRAHFAKLKEYHDKDLQQAHY